MKWNKEQFFFVIFAEVEERKPILEFVGPRMSGFNGSLNLGPLKWSGGKERHELRAGTSSRDGDIREILYHNTLL